VSVKLSEWLDEFDAASEAQVPCGACTACCTSSQFVHVEPDEVDTLARVPAALRFPAPGLPKGHVVLPYDERGHCPMLVDGACSIYEHRPRACRTYDCRVFAVTGVVPEGQPAIAARVAQWRFDVDDEARWDRVRASVPDDGPPIARALQALAATTGSGLAQDHRGAAPPGREHRHQARDRRRDEHGDEERPDQRG
jgi:Fe-S-cluster containining protein